MRIRARQVYLGAAQRYSVTYVYMISTYIHELYTGKLRQKSTWYTAAPSMITEWCRLEPCTRWYRVNGVRAQQIRQGAITCNKHSVLYCYRNCLSLSKQFKNLSSSSKQIRQGAITGKMHRTCQCMTEYCLYITEKRLCITENISI